MSTAVGSRAAKKLASGTLEHARIVSDPDAEQLFDFGLVRRAGRHPAIAEQRVARIDQHRRRAAPGATKGLLRFDDERRRHRATAVVGHEQRVAACRGLQQVRAERAAISRRRTARGRRRDRFARPAAWPNGCRRRESASSSACGTLSDARPAARRRARRSTSSRRRPVSSCPAKPIDDGRAAERRDVIGGVAGSSGDDLGRVVVEDQHRRLAGHARDVAVNELIDDQIAEHRDAHLRRIDR